MSAARGAGIILGSALLILFFLVAMASVRPVTEPRPSVASRIEVAILFFWEF